MKIKLNVLMYSLVLVFLSACNDNDEPTPGTIDRTVLMYIAGDNNLSTFAASDLAETIIGIQQVDVSKNNLLIYYDIQSSSSAKLIHLSKDKKGNVVQNIIQDYGDRNSVGLTEMKEVFSYVFSNYVAESYGLVFWSHGDGWIPSSTNSRWFGQDDNRTMNISAIAEALSTAPHFDFIFFDSCFMQSIEVVYELRNYADYFVGSPTEIPAPGAPYQVVVPAMFVKDNVAEEIASAYYDFHARNFTSTLGTDDPWDSDGVWVAGVSTSVVVSNKLEELAAKTNEILGKYVQWPLNTSNILCYDKRYSKYYYDLDGLIRSLTKENADYQSWDEIYRQAIPYNETTEINFSDSGGRFDMTGSRGLSTYMPRLGNSALNDFYKTYLWYEAGGWKNAGL